MAGSNKLQIRALNVAVLRPPRKPHARVVAPMLEQLALLGLEAGGGKLALEMRKELKTRMDNFRRQTKSQLQDAIDLHAKRFGDDWYGDHDPHSIEANRMTIVTTYGIYLTETAERLYEKLSEQDHTGSAELLTQAIQSISSVLSDGFYRVSTKEASQRFVDAQPFILAALRRAGLQELEPKEAFLATKGETLSRVEEAMDRIFGPEPVGKTA
jgi:hypothetical protein